MVKLSSQNAIIFLLLPFAITCYLHICESKASCNEKDKQILLCVKHGLTDPSGMLSTWSNKDDCCEWSGVQCDINGRIINISLPCFTQDVVVDGSNDHKKDCLTGGQLTLDFSLIYNNSMSWDMSNVLLNSEIVWLVANGLTGGLPRLTSNVSVLNLAVNNLSGPLSPLMCHEIKGKNNLQYLDISKNFLSDGLTDCGENWKSLIYVGLEENNFTGIIPHSIGTLSNLVSLQLNNNKLHGKIPRSLKNCQKLMILSLAENKFSGSIPNWMGPDVKALQLRSNEFNGNIPEQICQLSTLIVLDVANNRLKGIIPQCLSNITTMSLNNISTTDKFGILNARYGVVFAFSIALLTKGNELYYKRYMHAIDLSSTQLTGEIPMEVFKLTELPSLNLSRNQLRGTVPEEIGNLKNWNPLK